MKESERLRAAKRLIDSPEKWIRGAYSDTPASDFKNACRFCSVGAVLKARGEDVGAEDFNSTSEYLYMAVMAAGKSFGSVFDFNDNHSHAEVMQMFNKAIEIAESEGN